MRNVASKKMEMVVRINLSVSLQIVYSSTTLSTISQDLEARQKVISLGRSHHMADTSNVSCGLTCISTHPNKLLSIHIDTVLTELSSFNWRLHHAQKLHEAKLCPFEGVFDLVYAPCSRSISQMDSVVIHVIWANQYAYCFNLICEEYVCVFRGILISRT